MLEETLMQNGLSEKEAKVYLAVLAAGESPVSGIARGAGLERPTVYIVLEGMERMGLVSAVKRRGIRYFSALAPRLLVDRFQQSASQAERSLPALMEMAFSSPLKPRLRFFEGMEGLKEVLREFSRTTDDTMLFTDYASMPKDLLDFIEDKIVPERLRRRSFARLIAPRNEKNQAMGRRRGSKILAEHRFVAFPGNLYPVEVQLFDKTKVGFLSFPERERFGVIIDSAALYQGLCNIFEVLWLAAEDKGRGASPTP